MAKKYLHGVKKQHLLRIKLTKISATETGLRKMKYNS